MTTAALFPSMAKTAFMKLTGGRYDAMKVRLAKKGLTVPFTKQQLRVRVLANLGANYGGILTCPYCLKVCILEEVDFDHRMPLVRGGSPCLDNIGFPCSQCNAQKGDLTPEEFSKLLEFLEQVLPLVRISILKRLQEHSKLLASKRRSEMLIRTGGTKSIKIPRTTFI
jgi:hypothetical protein